MAYNSKKLVVKEGSGFSSMYGQSHWEVSGFETIEDAKEYVKDRCNALMGYSASGKVVKSDDRIIVHMSCWNSCD